MKFVNLIVMCLLVSSLVELKKKKKRKNLMARVFNVKVYVDSAKTFSEGTLDAKDVKIPPEGDKKKGIHFAITKLDPSLQPLITDSTEKGLKYIPYRLLNVEFTGTFPEKASKSLTTVVLKKGKSYVVKLEFEYDKDWDVITNEELTSLINWLNTNRTNRQSEIRALKTILKKIGTEYNELLGSLNSSKGGAEEIGKKVRENVASISKLDTENKELDKELVDTQKKISDSSSDLKNATNALKNSENLINGYRLQINQLKKTIENLQQASKDKGPVIQNAQSRMKAREGSFKTKLEDIKEEYGSDGKIIDEAINHLLNEKDLRKALRKLRSLNP